MNPTSTTLSIVAGAFTLALSAPSLPMPATAGRPAAQAPDTTQVVLAEVLFSPAAGDTAFVELANVGSRPADLTAFVLRVDTLDLPLPRLATPFAPGTRILIRFDGQGTTEGSVIHAEAGVVLEPTGGAVALLANDDRVLDRIAWGTADGAIMPAQGGFVPSRMTPGSSFGRPPGANQPGSSGDWVVYLPDQVSPGRPNPLPPVAQLMPLDGAILPASSATLSWYPVAGATRYRIQLAKDTSFAPPLLDQTVEQPSVSTGQLAPGVYRWRVQALGADRVAARWSRPGRLELERPAGGGQGRGMGGAAPVTLNVPYFTQHKDSPMLLLESQQSGGPQTAGRSPPVPHAWDRDHGRLDYNDPADNMNCAIASTEMLNRFYGGDLTQDRIGYEVFSANVRRYAARVVAQSFNQGAPTAPIERAPGPERDLNYGYGLSIEMVAAAGLFSLGAMPGPGSGYAPLDSIWNRSVAELNAGRPLLGFNCCHVFVIRGYERRGTRRLLYLNDPWPQPNMPGQYAFDIDSAGRPLGQLEGFMSYPSHPSVARMEPEALRDSDGDGVWDFDEINRFHTDPNNTDSDGDGVPDKRDIESGIYETEFGYGYAWNPSYNSPGRELDGDGKATELDPDSDDGGCKDGEEDVDHDGYRGGSETGNFKPGDDVCGNLQGNVSYAIHLINTDPGQIIRVIQDAGVIQVRLKPESPGSEHYVDDGSTFSYNGYARVEVDLGGCILFGRENASGSGTFTGDAEIGASRGDDGTLALGAQADVAGRAASGGCGQPGGSGPASRTMNFPDCDGVLAPQGAGPPGYKTYRFNCTTMALPPGPGWRLLSYYVRGYVRVQ